MRAALCSPVQPCTALCLSSLFSGPNRERGGGRASIAQLVRERGSGPEVPGSIFSTDISGGDPSGSWSPPAGGLSMGWGGWDPPVDRSANFRRAGLWPSGPWSPPALVRLPPASIGTVLIPSGCSVWGRTTPPPGNQVIPMVGH